MSHRRPADGEPVAAAPPPKGNAWEKGASQKSNNVAWNRVAALPATSGNPPTETFRSRKSVGPRPLRPGDVSTSKKKDRDNLSPKSPAPKKAKQALGSGHRQPAAKRISNPKLSATAPVWGHQAAATKTPTTVNRGHSDIAQYQIRSSDFPSLSTVASVGTQPAKSKPTAILQKPPVVLQKIAKTHDNKKPASSSKKKKKKTKASSQAPVKKPDLSNHPFFQQQTVRDLAGGEHDLLRLMQDGKMVVQKKGRQRLRPRKKKFSALKKKVLEERLRKWRELHPAKTPSTTSSSSAMGSSSVVLLSGYANVDELEDDDEFEEIQSNLQDMASKIGQVKRILIPRTIQEAEETVPSFVHFAEPNLAVAAVQCWNDLVLGGIKLKARLLVSKDGSGPPESREDWGQWCQDAMPIGGESSLDAIVVSGEDPRVDIFLDNALTEDDLEDDECMEQSLADIKAMASKLGELESLRVVREPAPYVILSYTCSERESREILENLQKTVIGGTSLIARLPTSAESTVVLRNVLSEDDVEDEDCLEESLGDLREIAKQFGSVVDVKANVEAATVEIVFETEENSKMAVGGLNGMIIGGASISATLLGSNASISESPMDPPAPKDETTVMYSGEKRIPERFAECKRVPKIPNSGKPRNYAVMSNDDAVKPLLSEMLSELMRLQRRAIEDKNAKARRRLVMGLREVARGIRAHKVKLVVMANNLDEYGVIDEKLQEIIDMCVREDVPVFFEFSKRTLGKALGKTIKVAVVGVQNAEGAHQQFKKLASRAPVLSSGLEDA